MSYCYYYPYMDLNKTYLGIEDYKFSWNNFKQIKLYFNKVNIVDKETYKWLKFHPNTYNLQFKLKEDGQTDIY